MKITINLLLAIAFFGIESHVSANNWHYETFDSNPMSRGWSIHGDKSLFNWNEIPLDQDYKNKAIIFEINDEIYYLWCTFSHDQVDFNFKSYKKF